MHSAYRHETFHIQLAQSLTDETFWSVRLVGYPRSLRPGSIWKLLTCTVKRVRKVKFITIFHLPVIPCLIYVEVYFDIGSSSELLLSLKRLQSIHILKITTIRCHESTTSAAVVSEQQPQQSCLQIMTMK